MSCNQMWNQFYQAIFLQAAIQWQVNLFTHFQVAPSDKPVLLTHFSSSHLLTSRIYWFTSQVAPNPLLKWHQNPLLKWHTMTSEHYWPTSQVALNDKSTLLSHFSTALQWQVNFTDPHLLWLTMTSQFYWSTSQVAHNDKLTLLIHFSSGS